MHTPSPALPPSPSRSLFLLAALTLAAACARPAASLAPAAAEVVLDASQVDRAPRLVDPARLVAAAPGGTLQGAAETGTATVAVVVGLDGRAEQAMVLRATSSALEPAAERVARRLRFYPALLAGEPVRARTEVTIQFRAAAVVAGGNDAARAGVGADRETGRTGS